MGASIDRFVEGARQVYAGSDDARAQAQGIAAELQTLLRQPGLMQEIEEIAAGRAGRIDLHIDDRFGHPGPGFCLMTSINRAGKRTGGARAHDGGGHWSLLVFRRGSAGSPSRFEHYDSCKGSANAAFNAAAR